MKLYLNSGKEPNFQKILIISVFLHILFITLVAIPLKTKKKEYKSYFVNLVAPTKVPGTVQAPRARKSVPPKKTTTKQTADKKGAVQMKAPPRKRTAPPKGVSLEPEKSAERVSNEIERLRAIKALSKRKEAQEESAARSKEREEEVASAIDSLRRKMQGSVSKGPGVQGTQPSTNTNSYAAEVYRIIRENWQHFDFKTPDLEVIISFKIDRKGRVVSPKTVKSSGNIRFDSSAMKAVRRSSPLPPPAVEEEIEVRFHL